MKTPTNRFRLSSLAVAVTLGMTASNALAADETQATEEEQIIEEVVAVGTRLKGSAAAVLQERKEQAFVADIMGAEQIARSGDTDAAGALRRVTGLTLVDGKFIYVRGLGERYSSTQLNGAAVPSPDPTRSVVPLDLFPSQVIESLAVQKSYSPSMPAAFGGGNVNVRIRTIPSEFTFNMTGKLGTDTENWDSDTIRYNGGSDDWFGTDDGTRQMPDSLANLWNSRTFLNDITIEENRAIAMDLNRDYTPEQRSIAPDWGFNAALGDSFESDSGDWRYGYLSAVSYDNNWDVSKEYQGELFRETDEGFDLVRGWDDVNSTEHSVRWSAMMNFGIDYKRNHRIDFSTMALHDTRDQVQERFGNTENLGLNEGLRVRGIDVQYEERELLVNQIKGSHTFPQFWYIGFDWMYSDSRSTRKAPGNFNSRYILEDANEDSIFDTTNEIQLSRARTAARYSFQDLHDKVENWTFDFLIPYNTEMWEMEFKVGGNFIKKARNAENRRFDVNTLAFANVTSFPGNRMADILTDEFIANADLSDRILRDTTLAGDDYMSGSMVDAGYFEFDMFYDNTWRFSGGFRWEDFRQVVAPLVPQTGQVDLPSDATSQDLLDFTFQEDDFYPAFALTYVYSPQTQFRASFSETVVRPDVREVSPATYIDPLTEYPVEGTPSIVTTNVTNYDFRWEYYEDDGDNLSIALFYKDMEKPIESVQSPSQDGPPLIRIANAETGEVYGVEVEFLQGLGFTEDWGLGKVGQDMFLSGNVTLSDSEIVLDAQNIVDQTKVSTAVTNLTRRLTGHSEYVVNMQLGYDSPDGEHSGSLVYNVFGERIIVPGIEGLPDGKEQPFHSLDLVYTYFPNFNSQIRFKINNILDEEKEITINGQTFRSETVGTGISIQYRYEF